MGCGIVTVKTCLGILSLFFWLCAVTLIVIGSLVLAEYGDFKELAQSVDVLYPSLILLAAGVFLFIVGVLGCIGGMKSNKAALVVFFILTLVILVSEVAAIALGYHFRVNIQKKLDNRMEEMIHKCVNSTDDKTDCSELNFVQRKMECCGADDYTDWYKWSVNETVPESCCRTSSCSRPDQYVNKTIAKKDIYTEGCVNKVKDYLEDQFSWILVGTIIVVVLQALGLVSTCVLLFRSRDAPYEMLDSQGYRI